MDVDQKTAVLSLSGPDAQCVVDAVNDVLRETNILASNEGKRVLSMLCKLVKSASVFPRCYRLEGVHVDSELSGAGGFADVYEGVYRGQKICVKIVRRYQKLDQLQILAVSVMTELVLWAHLVHQNILPFYGAYSGLSGGIYLISPWMKNGNLRVYLKMNPNPPKMLLVLDIINGLYYLRSLGVVHGDLKGENVLVSDQGRALIADFGISHVEASSRPPNTGSPNGTLRWTAPELLENNGDSYVRPTPESDVWSFGCVCYEILTLKMPFYQYGLDSVVVLALHRQEIPVQPALKDQVDETMWSIMARCWNYTPKERPSCEELLRFFEALELPDHRFQTSNLVEESATFWKAMKARSMKKTNYQRAYQVLTQVSDSSLSTGPLVIYLTPSLLKIQLTKAPAQIRALILEMIMNDRQSDLIFQVRGEDSQCIIDVINDVR
ncbi:kinase-like protein [Macrolepiota fuliginosa MF-IS2]|uniref:Kinase-like protein n=1 Tax=Macrolepiota fuliginosa MF-IS2 TaxID=1400762 RepID=A0A9P5X930_9AGAR|nr:kinase-like protein [Macrolepiota fuliginosa MF-IS2]